MLGIILFSTVMLSALSAVGLAFFHFRERAIDRTMLPLTAFASGVLLGVAFLYVLPEALQGAFLPEVTFLIALFGVIILFVLERVFYWHHLHEGISEIHPFTHLNLLGDAIHNLINGMAIAAAFLASALLGASPLIGVMTAFAILVHAVPQELSDFALLLHGGMKKSRALVCSFASAATAILGAFVVYFFIPTAAVRDYLLPLISGAFIYTAAVDLVPRLHLEDIRKRSVVQLACFLVGVILVQMISMFT
jgi:zinc and cadmium transporter